MRNNQKKTALTLAGAALCAVLVSCGAPSQDDMSQVQHDEDHPTRGTAEWMWASGNDADYDRTIAPLLGLETNSFLPAEHALVRKVQTWVDRLDSKLRSQHGDQMVNVPRPRARVTKDASVNAFVAPAPVCYSVPVKLRSSGTTANQVYLDLGTGTFEEFPDDLKCLTGDNAAATIRDLVAKFNATSSSCRLTIDGSGALVVGSTCEIGADAAGIGTARKLVVLEAASFVTVFAGLFPAMSEEAFVAVIAHELGHYYRAHTTSFEPEYDFFYQAKETADGRKPSADSSLKSAGKDAQLGTKMLSTTDMHMDVPGATLRPELYFAIGSVINQVCSAGSCPAVCTTAKTLANSASFDTAMGQFPFGYDADGVGATYKGFEAKARACLAQLKVSSSGSSVTGTTVGWSRIVELVRTPVWPEWLGQLSPRGKAMLVEVGEMTAGRIGSQGSAASLDAALLRASESLDRSDDQAVTYLKRAVDQRIGYYTAEEEADDESVEWIAGLGIDPANGVDAMRRLGKGLETGLRGYSLGESDCNVLQQRHWRDASGDYVFVPVGDFTEPHHSVCYRMFNMEREVAAHHVTPASGTDLPVMNGQAWSDLQELALSVSRANPTPPIPHAIIKGDRSLQCLFAPDFGWAK